MEIALGIPTLNAGASWQDTLIKYGKQSLQPQRKLILDSGSKDATVKLAQEAGFDVVTIEPREFCHGHARNVILDHLASADILILATQDAVPADEYTLERLVTAFSREDVAAAYARQLPAADADPFATHARLFNYPAESCVKTKADIPRLGLKTVFLSNSFAGYRVRDLKAVGGFSDKLSFGEDMYVAAKLVQNGNSIAYVAESRVYHSHNYSTLQELRRYCDIGMFHAQESWIAQTFGGASGEGRRFVLSKSRYLLRHAPLWLPLAPLRHMAKWGGFWLGKHSWLLPRPLRSWLSMYWVPPQ
ncbi:MAG: glycosyltransferase [Lentisphaerae bacterium]|nr:MAG: glycosyltransferase [Lentisphaerota bacterium]